MPRKKEKRASALPKEATEIEQVVSVQVSAGQSGTLFSDGITALKEAFFTSVAPVSVSKSNRISGIAPNDGTNMFVIIEYVPRPMMMNAPIKIHLIHQDCKVLIEEGRVMFETSGDDNTKSYSITGDKIGSWEIVTKQIPAEVLTKARLFENEAMTS